MSEAEIIEEVEKILQNESIPESEKEEIVEYALHEKLKGMLRKPP